MPEKKLNIHEKLLKIADVSGVLRKNKSGFNYKYTTEDEIQAKITAGMQKYGVMLYPSLVPGSLSIIPYHYDKPKTPPVHCFGFAYNVLNYTDGLNECLWLLERADEMWVCGDYRSSKGCQAEIEFCKSHKIPFTIKPNKNSVII